SARVRFSSQPGVTHTIPASNEVSLEDLRNLPLPSHVSDEAYHMDIFTAASIGNVEIVERWLRNNDAANAVNRSGWSALLYAAQLDHAEICGILVSRGANVNQANKKGQTSLMLAAACGNLNTVKVLLERGADVRAADRKGREALHVAAACSQQLIVAELLTKGADPNAQDKELMTPTLEACTAGHEQTLLSLLAKGGNAYACNAQGEDGRLLAADSAKILEVIEGAPRSLTELLVRMSLEKYEDKLREENVDSLDVFFDLNDQDLTDMKIPYGPKKRMLAVIDHYEKTKEINPGAVESGNSPAVSRIDAPSSVQQQEVASTLRHIVQQNDECKRLAMTAFEHREDPAQLCQLLAQIINCCDQIATRLARHSTS
ncbi:hypothetical protein PFISCL1PPCAC_15892, partial [Pristionchus fissidentatus]